MLSSLVKDHHAKQAAKKEELGNKNKLVIIAFTADSFPFLMFAEQNRKEAVAASSELTQALVDHLNVG